MEREERYLVFKIKDVANYFSIDEREKLVGLHKKVSDCRVRSGKQILECAVVESDWPEFEPTWQAVSDRVDSENGVEVTTNKVAEDTNISFEIGRLLIYIADVATAIRLNSPYRGDYWTRNRNEVGLDVMWLSDSLHCLDRLGKALRTADHNEIASSCEDLIDYYRLFEDDVVGEVNGLNRKGDPKAVMKHYDHLFDPKDAVAIFTDIRDKLLACNSGGANYA
ncbi:MAG: hypothetical protein ACU84J_14355, partial [Gammaproteobacteria bacterium]